MKSKFAAGYLIFSIVFLLCIAGWLGIGINSARNSARTECERQFTALKDAIAASYLIDSRFDAPYFQDLIKRSIASQQRLRTLVIGTQAGGVEYVYASDRSYIPQGPPYPEKSPPPVPVYNSFSEFFISAPVFLPATTGLSVQAVYRTFSRSDMISILKNILIAVILFLIATSIILIVFSVRDNKNEPRRERAADGQPESPPAAAAESPAAGEQAAAAEQTPKTQRATDTEQAAATQPSVPEETAQPAPSGITGLAAASPDGGLFSTRSGLGWESYLEQRLDSELKRAASFDQDLSCVAFACDDSCDDSDYHNAAQRILETFMFKDLAFEYGKNGFVVILPNIDLDQALVKVEGFIKRIEEIPHSLLLHAGISSRNGRLMHANLLLKEAVRGLEKARCEGENRIIAFRTDPARFRQFIAAKD